MKARPIDQLVYNCMFPKPKPNDPRNFQGLLAQSLVPEVRLETQAFYGSLSSQEAKYPGLDYSYPPHRQRLARYQWHRRLFRAFDHLRLTESEIAGLTKWEGTRWAKVRFEKEQGVRIRDTTGEEIEQWMEPEERAAVAEKRKRDAEMLRNMGMGGRAEMRDVGNGVTVFSMGAQMNDDDEDEEEEEEEEEEESESESEIQSVGIELNERLRAAVAQREAGNPATVMDEEWEQWLKDAVEAGGMPFMNPPGTTNTNNTSTSTSTTTREGNNNRGLPPLHPRLLNAARLGQWNNIPDFLQDMVRANIEAAADLYIGDSVPGASQATTFHPVSAQPTSSHPQRRTTSSTPTSRNMQQLQQQQYTAERARRTLPPPTTANNTASSSRNAQQIQASLMRDYLTQPPAGGGNVRSSRGSANDGSVRAPPVAGGNGSSVLRSQGAREGRN